MKQLTDILLSLIYFTELDACAGVRELNTKQIMEGVWLDSRILLVMENTVCLRYKTLLN